MSKTKSESGGVWLDLVVRDDAGEVGTATINLEELHDNATASGVPVLYMQRQLHLALTKLLKAISAA